MNYYVAKNNERTGPFSEREVQNLLVSGNLGPDDLIWKQGMADWQPVRTVVAMMEPPPLPPTLNTPAIPQNNPFDGKAFLLAKINNFDSSNHYDVINIETGKIVIQIRKAELTSGGKFTRSGILDRWVGGQIFSKFDVTLSDLSGAVYMVLKGGGMGGHSDVFKLSGEKIGGIKRTSMVNLHFEAFAEEGTLFKVVSKGFGKITFEQCLFDKNEQQFGKVVDSGWNDAKEVLGDRIRMIDSDSVFRSKYCYKQRIELDKELTVKEKCFLFGALYQLSQVAGD